jgi:hypothetical protein
MIVVLIQRKGINGNLLLLKYIAMPMYFNVYLNLINQLCKLHNVIKNFRSEKQILPQFIQLKTYEYLKRTVRNIVLPLTASYHINDNFWGFIIFSSLVQRKVTPTSQA